jgi:hypothetical protein
VIFEAEKLCDALTAPKAGGKELSPEGVASTGRWGGAIGTEHLLEKDVMMLRYAFGELHEIALTEFLEDGG